MQLLSARLSLAPPIVRARPPGTSQVGNWLVFSQIGACTAVYGSGFKGFNTADILTCLLIKIELTGHVTNCL
ncbi:hypothetical protein CUMW_196430, partial [Citrus unshiu]